jgi:phage terminase Nu1 subunit (DNA packaging protein)
VAVSELRVIADELVDRKEMAKILRVSVPTLDRMRRAGMPCHRWGRRLVRFRVRECIAWAEQRDAEEAA